MYIVAWPTVPEIGLNGLLLDWPHSGTATYTRNLVEHLPAAAPDLDFRLYTRNPTWQPAEVVVRRLRTPFRCMDSGSGLGSRLDKLVWETVSLPLAAAGRPGLIHSLYFAAPLLSPVPVVVTIHDVIRLVLPCYHRSRQAELYSRFMSETAKRAAAIVTVSDHARDDIVRILGVPRERVYVTHEAAGGEFSSEKAPGEGEEVRARYGLPERFLLYLGSAERRKNLETLLRAWALVVDDMRSREVRLVLVTDLPTPDALYPDIRHLITELGIEDDVLIVSHVEEGDKPALYRAALGLCFPSTYEGFGLPPLESMASGTPVLASNASSIPEVVGDGAHLLPPHDIASWAGAMLALVDSTRWREDLRARGLKRAGQYSWARTARETVDVYREVLN